MGKYFDLSKNFGENDQYQQKGQSIKNYENIDDYKKGENPVQLLTPSNHNGDIHTQASYLSPNDDPHFTETEQPQQTAPHEITTNNNLITTNIEPTYKVETPIKEDEVNTEEKFGILMAIIIVLLILGFAFYVASK